MLVESSGGLPKTDVVFELRLMMEGSNEHVNSSEFWYVVTSGLEEFVVAGDAAAEIAKLVELRKGGSNNCFDCSSFVVGDVPHVALSSLIKSRGDKEPTPNRCLELILSSVIRPMLARMAACRSALVRCCSSKA